MVFTFSDTWQGVGNAVGIIPEAKKEGVAKVPQPPEIYLVAGAGFEPTTFGL